MNVSFARDSVRSKARTAKLHTPVKIIEPGFGGRKQEAATSMVDRPTRPVISRSMAKDDDDELSDVPSSG